MIKRLAFILACLGFSIHLSSCTSNESQSNTDESAVANAESADLEKIDGEKESEGDQSLASDQIPEDALGEAPETDRNPAKGIKESATDQNAVTEVVPEAGPAESVASSIEPSAAPTEIASVEPAPMEPSSAIAEASPAAPENTTIVDGGEAAAPKKTPAPLQKIATEPWKVGKVWYNSVYFARPGDTLKSVSKMIYGSDKSSLLKKGNASLASRKLKAGDKIYYNSPLRPDDSTRMLTYYEDNGLAPEVYVAKEGENLKKLSKSLLGFENAWKEIWASNPVDSKDKLTEGTELRYWKAQPAPMAAAPMPEMPTAPNVQDVSSNMSQSPAENIQGALPPPPTIPEPPKQEAANQLPPPPPAPPEMAAGQVEPGQNAPPPPPPSVQAGNNAVEPAAESADANASSNQDTNNALAAAGILAAGAAILIVMRKKKKQKDLEQQALENTHVV